MTHESTTSPELDAVELAWWREFRSRVLPESEWKPNPNVPLYGRRFRIVSETP